MLTNHTTIAQCDPTLWRAMQDEAKRQEDHIELIASENYVSQAILEAQGSILTNKYAEGYPGKRYYGGCEYVDIAEQLAIARAKELFQADYVNVQPHSGSQANAAAMMAMLKPGELVLGMALAHGGHLTHGSHVNFSGQMYRSMQYGLNGQGLIDYDAMEAMALEHKPKLIIAGFSAYSQQVDWAKFRAVADKIGAYFLADIAHVAGLIATGLYPSPIPFADVITTTTHKTLRGPRGGMILAKANPALEKKLSSAVFPGTQGGPLMHVIAAKAVAFLEALQPEFKQYQQQVLENADTMASVLIERGYRIVSGGTQNHLILVDMIDKNITGKDADAALSRAHITVNKNTVPNDPRSPFITSGLRLGTPAVTTRGFKQQEITLLTHWIADLLDSMGDEPTLTRIKKRVLELCAAFPVYQ